MLPHASLVFGAHVSGKVRGAELSGGVAVIGGGCEEVRVGNSDEKLLVLGLVL